MSRNISVGIDVGTRSTRVVVVEYINGKPGPTVLGTAMCQSRGLKHGYIVNEQEATQSVHCAIKAAERSSGLKIKEVFLSIGGISLEAVTTNGFVLLSRTDGEITNEEKQKTIQTSRDNVKNSTNKKVIDTIPISYKIDGKDVLGKPDGMKGSKFEVKTLFIMCLEQHFNQLVRVVEEAGVEVLDVIASPIAASLVALTKRQRVAGCLLANIGAETVSISVFEDDIPISLQVFPIGSTDITNDIALGLQITLEEAEKIKIGEGNGSYVRRQLDEIVEARLSDIFELIESHLKKIGRNGLLPAGIVLTGGGAGISTIEDFAKASLRLPSKRATSEIAEMQSSGKNINDSSWFVAYGLCIYGFNQTMTRAPIMKMIGPHQRRIFAWLKQFLP
ncbi:MAG: cell division protein FtsA [Candidatus Yonathbacteria bacterium CG_4_10_14_3_um_filter_47_65]|uniref:Cell division protein FtsA n=2 Tax=Parcubacteria group TaxID=1794811 RepID=A0A2M8DA95_9BACT|nr:MAG: cell division protein FtsA [Candidatus Nomurabacteria bacterium CG1_02_47_685]PIP03632.1 MAG: cell division protein FtsA [Candidatus Yonathbacteria bacterium CG23_combo_of_CG06-09_8_20_14_all_46_18]PIQ33137.1 MAG: cell division protein FtsA [Candidatus Yonathbacteria bacterium CG17_big_fil_post_rev_8_21_14_2_50_46_19]PIX56021.1 MAG: cell division protein FtsA [Candidatus Yonathbacteria bacterium CG_4_10_14_3_um_filter_47_65]PIY57680.1 MAG: cell division protein FtsA [Candidatus Yonathba